MPKETRLATVSNEFEPYALELLEVLMNAAKAVQETDHELYLMQQAPATLQLLAPYGLIGEILS